MDIKSLPPEKKFALITMAEEARRAADRRSADIENAVQDLDRIQEREDQEALLSESMHFLSSLRAAEEQYADRMREATVALFEALIGESIEDLFNRFAEGDDPGNPVAAFGLGDDGEAEIHLGVQREDGIEEIPLDQPPVPDLETQAVGDPTIPGIDPGASFHEDLRVEPSTQSKPDLDTGDIVARDDEDRKGMIIKLLEGNQAEIRWFGEDAPNSPQIEDLGSLVRAEREAE